MIFSEFYLMNEKEDRYSLCDPDSGLFIDPSGFGYEMDTSYIKVGSVWVNSKKELKQGNISGNIVFPHNPYEAFKRFIDFANAAEELKLIFRPAKTGTEYFRDIDVVKIDKGGYNRRSQLVVPVSFACRSLFYTEEKFEHKIDKSSREVRFPIVWSSRFNDLNNLSYMCENDSHVESPFTLSFRGYCVNPTIKIVQNAKIVHETTFQCTLEQSDVLEYSTFDTDLYITINGEDAKSILSIDNENFFKIPKGTSDMYFSCETGRFNRTVLTFEKYYKGV